MLEKKYDANILILSLPLAVLTAIVSYAGIFIDSTYAKETAIYASQGIGQDIINLFVVVPILIVAAFFAYRKSRTGLFIWSGTIFYLAYSYTIYSFGLHFNYLFIAYCVILGLSFYSLIYFVITSLHENISGWFSSKVPTQSTGIFLIVISLLFYFIWLSEIIPAIFLNQTPQSVVESGLLINPVHVLDIAICLPALLITGIALIKKRSVGLLLAPTMLVFCIFMALAIAAMVIVMKSKGLESNMVLFSIFGTITGISIFFLIRIVRTLN